MQTYCLNDVKSQYLCGGKVVIKPYTSPSVPVLLSKTFALRPLSSLKRLTQRVNNQEKNFFSEISNHEKTGEALLIYILKIDLDAKTITET